MFKIDYNVIKLTPQILDTLNIAFGEYQWAISGSNLFYLLGIVDRDDIDDIDICVSETGYENYKKYHHENFVGTLYYKKCKPKCGKITNYSPALFYSKLFLTDPLIPIDVFVYSDDSYEKYAINKINLFDRIIYGFDINYIYHIKKKWCTNLNYKDAIKKHQADCKKIEEYF